MEGEKGGFATPSEIGLEPMRNFFRVVGREEGSTGCKKTGTELFEERRRKQSLPFNPLPNDEKPNAMPPPGQRRGKEETSKGVVHW
jgi:hypothetical protein